MKTLLLFFQLMSPVADTVQQGGDYPSYLSLQNCVILDLGPSVQSENKNLIYSWDFGDGQRKLGIVSEHCYDEIGDYEAILSVTDPYSGTHFRDEYYVDVEIRPSVELDIVEESAQILSAELSAASEIEAARFYWDIDGQYHIGDQIEGDFIKGAIQIRLLAIFTYRGEVVQLSKTVIR